MEFPFRVVSQNLNLIINLDANLINKRACKLLRHSKIFSPRLSPTLAKLHNEVSRLTNFWKLKFNHRFKPHLENKSACQLSRCWELFSPSWSQTLTKLNDAVSALTRFLEFKPDHMFGCILEGQACMRTFSTFQAILTPLKPNPNKTAWCSLSFDQILRI